MRFNLATAFILSLSLLSTGFSISQVNAMTLFAAGNSNMNTPIYTIDTTTGVQTTLGNSGFPNVQSLAFSPTGVLYGTTFSSGGSNMSLLTINQTTGSGTIIGPITPTAGTNSLNAATGLAFTPSGTAYLVGRDFNQTGSLYSLNPTTGVVSLIGSTNAGQTQDMAIAPNGSAFAVNINSVNSPGLRSLNLATGNTTLLPSGGSTVNLTSMTFAPDGTLWIGGAGNLYTANTTTGALTLQRSGLATYQGLANFAPVPVPAAVWLFGSGLAALVGLARRRTS